MSILSTENFTVIESKTVNENWTKVLEVVRNGEVMETRNGPAKVVSHPVMTVTSHPRNRVLLQPGRKTNPFFHLFESLWILDGGHNAIYLDRFIKDFSNRFGDDDGNQFDAYGYRMRRHWAGLDQMKSVIKKLRSNPNDRQAVISLWDPHTDLEGSETGHVPCNTQLYFRVYGNSLNMTVTCRSNDAIWGLMGANIVQFSIIQEVMASMMGLDCGTLHQLSNNLHGYLDTLEPCLKLDPIPELGLRHDIICEDPDYFFTELNQYLAEPTTFRQWRNTFLYRVAEPMLRVHNLITHGMDPNADDFARIRCDSWRNAAWKWHLERKGQKWNSTTLI